MSFMDVIEEIETEISDTESTGPDKAQVGASEKLSEEIPKKEVLRSLSESTLDGFSQDTNDSLAQELSKPLTDGAATKNFKEDGVERPCSEGSKRPTATDRKACYGVCTKKFSLLDDLIPPECRCKNYDRLKEMFEGSTWKREEFKVRKTCKRTTKLPWQEIPKRPNTVSNKGKCCCSTDSTGQCGCLRKPSSILGNLTPRTSCRCKNYERLKTMVEERYKKPEEEASQPHGKSIELTCKPKTITPTFSAKAPEGTCCKKDVQASSIKAPSGTCCKPTELSALRKSIELMYKPACDQKVVQTPFPSKVKKGICTKATELDSLGRSIESMCKLPCEQKVVQTPFSSKIPKGICFKATKLNSLGRSTELMYKFPCEQKTVQTSSGKTACFPKDVQTSSTISPEGTCKPTELDALKQLMCKPACNQEVVQTPFSRKIPKRICSKATELNSLGTSIEVMCKPLCDQKIVQTSPSCKIACIPKNVQVGLPLFIQPSDDGTQTLSASCPKTSTLCTLTRSGPKESCENTITVRTLPGNEQGNSGLSCEVTSKVTVLLKHPESPTDPKSNSNTSTMPNEAKKSQELEPSTFKTSDLDSHSHRNPFMNEYLEDLHAKHINRNPFLSENFDFKLGDTTTVNDQQHLFSDKSSEQCSCIDDKNPFVRSRVEAEKENTANEDMNKNPSKRFYEKDEEEKIINVQQNPFLDELSSQCSCIHIEIDDTFSKNSDFDEEDRKHSKSKQNPFLDEPSEQFRYIDIEPKDKPVLSKNPNLKIEEEKITKVQEIPFLNQPIKQNLYLHNEDMNKNLCSGRFREKGEEEKTTSVQHNPVLDNLSSHCSCIHIEIDDKFCKNSDLVVEDRTNLKSMKNPFLDEPSDQCINVHVEPKVKSFLSKNPNFKVKEEKTTKIQEIPFLNQPIKQNLYLHTEDTDKNLFSSKKGKQEKPANVQQNPYIQTENKNQFSSFEVQKITNAQPFLKQLTCRLSSNNKFTTRDDVEKTFSSVCLNNSISNSELTNAQSVLDEPTCGVLPNSDFTTKDDTEKPFLSICLNNSTSNVELTNAQSYLNEPTFGILSKNDFITRNDVEKSFSSIGLNTSISNVERDSGGGNADEIPNDSTSFISKQKIEQIYTISVQQNPFLDEPIEHTAYHQSNVNKNPFSSKNFNLNIDEEKVSNVQQILFMKEFPAQRSCCFQTEPINQSFISSQTDQGEITNAHQIEPSPNGCVLTKDSEPQSGQFANQSFSSRYTKGLLSKSGCIVFEKPSETSSFSSKNDVFSVEQKIINIKPSCNESSGGFGPKCRCSQKSIPVVAKKFKNIAHENPKQSSSCRCKCHRKFSLKDLESELAITRSKTNSESFYLNRPAVEEIVAHLSGLLPNQFPVFEASQVEEFYPDCETENSVLDENFIETESVVSTIAVINQIGSIRKRLCDGMESSLHLREVCQHECLTQEELVAVSCTSVSQFQICTQTSTTSATVEEKNQPFRSIFFYCKIFLVLIFLIKFTLPSIIK